MSHDVNTVSARFIYGFTTIHDGSATIHHGGATNAHDASKIRYGASMVQAGSFTTSSRCATKNEPDAATVELRFRPHPQSTTFRPECFKRFKTVVAL